MPRILKFRPARDDDEPFLKVLRTIVDAERLGLMYWSPEDIDLARKVVKLQFAGHKAHYNQVKADWDTKDCIIEIDGQPVGRFILTQDSKVVCLCDLAVTPAYRGQGVGGAAIDMIRAECTQSKRVLRLHAEILGPGVHFYLHLGFRIVEQTPTHYRMEWAPPTMPAKPQIFLPKQG